MKLSPKINQRFGLIDHCQIGQFDKHHRVGADFLAVSDFPLASDDRIT